MYAFQLTDPNRGSYVEIDRPEPREDELLIRVHRAGLCGTDVEMWRGTMPYFKLGWAQYPVVLGHEWSGTVLETGSMVDDFQVGAPGEIERQRERGPRPRALHEALHAVLLGSAFA